MEAIILDFDGVIIDSMELKAAAFSRLFYNFGKDKVDEIIDFHLKNGGMSRYEKIKIIYEIFLDKKITPKQIKLVDQQLSEDIMSKISECKFIKGIKEFLENNHKKYKMYISSGTPEYELKNVVKLLGIDIYFKQIYGSPKSKKEHIKNILADEFLFPQQVVFIGDALKDKEAAEFMKLNFIARISSNNSALKTERYKIFDFTNIEEILKQIDNSQLIV